MEKESILMGKVSRTTTLEATGSMRSACWRRQCGPKAGGPTKAPASGAELLKTSDVT